MYETPCTDDHEPDFTPFAIQYLETVVLGSHTTSPDAPHTP